MILHVLFRNSHLHRNLPVLFPEDSALYENVPGFGALLLHHSADDFLNLSGYYGIVSVYVQGRNLEVQILCLTQSHLGKSLLLDFLMLVMILA